MPRVSRKSEKRSRSRSRSRSGRKRGMPAYVSSVRFQKDIVPGRDFPAHWESKRPKRSRSRQAGSASQVSTGVELARATKLRSRVPQMVRTQRGTRIKHSELIDAAVTGQTAFTPIHRAINPGLAAVFPWLSVQAPSWERYKFHKLEFEYIQRTSATVTGSILMSFDYDGNDDGPVTEQQMVASQGAVCGACWQNLRLRPSTYNMAGLTKGGQKNVRTGAMAGVDRNLTDVGIFTLATVDFAGTTPVGKLWVHYDVEFEIPQLGGVTLPPMRNMTIFYDATQTFATGTPATWVIAGYGQAGLTDINALGIPAPTAGTWTPPQGRYLIHVNAEWNCTTASVDCIFACSSVVNTTATSLCTLRWSGNSAGTPEARIVSFYDWHYFNGTDTYRFDVTLTSATGSLLLGNSVVIFSLL